MRINRINLLLFVLCAMVAAGLLYSFWPCPDDGDSASVNSLPTVQLCGAVQSFPAVPDPSNSPYPDCLIQLLVSFDPAGSNQAILVTWAYQDRTLTNSIGTLQVGDTVNANGTEWEDVPKRIQSSMSLLVETLNFDLPVIFADTLEINPEIKRHGLHGLKSNSPLATSQPGEYPFKAVREQHAETAHQRHAATLLRHGGLQKWLGENTAQQDLIRNMATPTGEIRKEALYGRNLEMFETKIDDGETWCNHFIDSMSTLTHYLEDRGIALVVLPFPRREDVTFPQLLGDSDTPFSDPYRTQVFAELTKAGVDTVDVLPAFKRDPDDLYYDVPDLHPKDKAIRIAARELALHCRPYLEGLDLEPLKSELKQKTYRITKKGHQAPTLGHKKGTVYKATQVTHCRGKALGSASQKSPILIAGDSFIGVPGNFGVSGDFVSHFSHEVSGRVDRFARSGGSPTMPAHLHRDAATWQPHTKLVIFVFNSKNIYLSHKDLAEAGREWVILSPQGIE